MCVIAICEDVRPSDEQVGQMWDQNSRGGGGCAWRAPASDGSGRMHVFWKKGLKREEMVLLNKQLPKPYILHFRQPSQDTSQSLFACHPFAINAEATADFEGEIDGWVLFHNGFWGPWRHDLKELAVHSGGAVKIPSGAWSDSRALALMAFYTGFGTLEMINEKVIAFGPDPADIEMFGTPWSSVTVPGEGSKTIIVSNKTWERTIAIVDRRHHAGHQHLLGAAHDIATGRTGGSAQDTSFRSGDDDASGEAESEGNQQESVQEAAESALTGVVSGSANRGIGALGPTRNICTGCGKHTPAGTEILRQWFCYQCWSSLPQAAEERAAANTWGWVGRCQTCRVASSGMRLITNDNWICMPCWESNGRERVRFARDAA